MKKSLPILIIIIVLLLVTVISVIWQPLNLFGRVDFISKLFNNNTLTINSPNGKSSIEIDGKSYGETNQTISDLDQGVHTVTLTRIVNNEESTQNFYQEVNFQIEINNNTESIINVEIGPSGLLYGYMLYYSKLTTLESDKSYISVISNEPITNINLDNEFYGETPINRKDVKPSSYKLSATANGYEGLDLPIITRKGYNLNVFVYLFPIPIEGF